jgi:hypothetical protein
VDAGGAWVVWLAMCWPPASCIARGGPLLVPPPPPSHPPPSHPLPRPLTLSSRSPSDSAAVSAMSARLMDPAPCLSRYSNTWGGDRGGEGQTSRVEERGGLEKKAPSVHHQVPPRLSLPPPPPACLLEALALQLARHHGAACVRVRGARDLGGLAGLLLQAAPRLLLLGGGVDGHGRGGRSSVCKPFLRGCRAPRTARRCRAPPPPHTHPTHPTPPQPSPRVLTRSSLRE